MLQWELGPTGNGLAALEETYKAVTGLALLESTAPNIQSPESYELVANVRQLLSFLDYRSQTHRFDDAVDGSPARAFVIHGESQNGQRWLLNRLVYSNFGDLDPANRIVLSPPRDDIDVQEFWDCLGDRLLNERSAAPSKILDYLFQRWQQEDVVLVVNDADRMLTTTPCQIMQQLWQPLMQRFVEAESASKPKHKMYLFILDNLGTAESWQLKCAEDLEEDDWDAPIALPMIQAFKQRDVKTWVGQCRGLPNLLPSPQTPEQVSERLWRKGRQGIPEPTMQAICDRISPNPPNQLWFDILNSLAL